MTKYYVYFHFRADDSKLFYIGKGCRYRYKEKTSRSEYWNRIESKHGLIAKKMFINLTEEEAFELEKKYIAIYKDILCNHTDGGEGASGRKLSQISRKKISDSNKGKKLSKESIEKRNRTREERGISYSKRAIEAMSKVNRKMTEDQIDLIFSDNIKNLAQKFNVCESTIIKTRRKIRKERECQQ